MYETAIDLLNAGSVRTLTERFTTEIHQRSVSVYRCSRDVEEGDMVYLDEDGLIRPVRESNASPFLGLCVGRPEQGLSSVVSTNGSVMNLTYEGEDPLVGSVVYVSGRLVKGTVSTRWSEYEVGIVVGNAKHGEVPVDFRPKAVR